jgi:hypothetical protein
MAEIKIEQKSPVWPWILVAILVIGVVAWLLMRDDGGTDDQMATEPRQEQRSDAGTATRAAEERRADGTMQTGAVQEYVSFVDNGREMGLDHEYTSAALERLQNAVRAKADQLNYDIQADLDRIDDHVGHITDDPMETTHANHIRSAADALSSAMRNMQKEHYPDLDQQARQVEQAASGIDPNTLTLDQRDAVKGFFNSSAELLRNMN